MLLPETPPAIACALERTLNRFTRKELQLKYGRTFDGNDLKHCRNALPQIETLAGQLAELTVRCHHYEPLASAYEVRCRNHTHFLACTTDRLPSAPLIYRTGVLSFNKETRK